MITSNTAPIINYCSHEAMLLYLHFKSSNHVAEQHNYSMFVCGWVGVLINKPAGTKPIAEIYDPE